MGLFHNNKLTLCVVYMNSKYIFPRIISRETELNSMTDRWQKVVGIPVHCGDFVGAWLFLESS